MSKINMCDRNTQIANSTCGPTQYCKPPASAEIIGMMSALHNKAEKLLIITRDKLEKICLEPVEKDVGECATTPQLRMPDLFAEMREYLLTTDSMLDDLQDIIDRCEV